MSIEGSAGRNRLPRAPTHEPAMPQPSAHDGAKRPFPSFYGSVESAAPTRKRCGNPFAESQGSAPRKL